MTADWISAETEPKENDFRGILTMHMTACRGILQRYGGPPYLYVDLFAGRGHLEFEGRRFPGSPLIAHDITTQLQLPSELLCFEKDPDEAALLTKAFVDLHGRPPVIEPRACEAGFSDWLRSTGYQPKRYGLIYADPIRDEIPHRLLNMAASRLPKVDLLSYVSANQYKRRRGVDPARPLFVEHVVAVRKKQALIREPIGKWQWTFILWSNWPDLPEWHKRGFYRLDSERGAQILDRLNLTSRELHEKSNAPLFEMTPEPEYATYAEYLRHPRFLNVRAEVFRRAGGTCERCGQRPPTEPHHLRYPPWGEFDVPENLIAICRQCHCEIHGKAA